jgi:hypothetical protein
MLFATADGWSIAVRRVSSGVASDDGRKNASGSKGTGAASRLHPALDTVNQSPAAPTATAPDMRPTDRMRPP